MSDHTVNQESMVRRVARRAGVTQPVARLVLRAFYDEVASTLARGGEIRITNFGTWRTTSRVRRNPQTGAMMPVKTFASWVPRGRIRDIVSGEIPVTTLKKDLSGPQL